MLMSDVAPARASSHSPFHKLFPVSNEAPYGSELLRSRKHAFIKTGESDLLLILDAAEGGNVTKFARAISSQGNIRTRTAKAWPEAEYVKMISELP